MTREETKKIIRIMCDSYPNYKPMDLSETVDVWTMMLGEYTYEQISVALKAYVLSDTSGFAPSVGQLVAKVQTITQPQELNEMEAWALVSKALRNCQNNFMEEYAKLPPVVQRAVGLPGQLRAWSIDENFNESVIMSQFQKCYRVEAMRNEELKRMPSEVKKLVQDALESSPVAQIREKEENVGKCLAENKNVLEDKIEHLNGKEHRTNAEKLIDELEEEWNGHKRSD